MSELLWSPSKERVEASSMYRLMQKCGHQNYADFHQYSIEQPEDFWIQLIQFYDLIYSGDLKPALGEKNFEKYTWFEDVKLNFAENLLRHKDRQGIALRSLHESGKHKSLTYRELYAEVSKLVCGLKGTINKGDVLACYMPNIPETVISMLAVSSLGGTFTSTSSDFGIEGVLDRFEQSRPKVLVAVAGYEYNGKYFDLTERLIEIEKRLPGLEKIIVVDFLNRSPNLSKFKKAILWQDILGDEDVIEFVPVPFAHPQYIMYSSGTTGKPKCIVHSVGGTLVQHIKELGLHSNLTLEKNIFYFTTCGWMMWNWLVSSLFFGAKVTLYEGSPGYPSLKEFTSLIDSEGVELFGTSPKFLKALEDSGYDNDFGLQKLETLLSTGAPLIPEQFDFVYQKIKSDIQIASICGGTDIIGCFMLGNPLLPVYRGEIQCLGLGMDVACFDEQGNELVDREGELVCKQTFPSRPIYFLNDFNNEKIKEAYFNRFPGVWHHGDFITLTKRKSVKVFGRSDATLNPGGVRIGTAEIYRQTESLNFIEDSLCVGQPEEGDVSIVLFVKLKEKEELSDERVKTIKTLIRQNTTPRHVPKSIYPIQDIPYTRSGKKMELAIARILAGKEITNKEAIANPECLEEYLKYV